MRLRFQRRVKVLPGVTLNFSKSGVTTSVGVRGARVTIGRGQTRTTLGLPGTGLSVTEVRKSAKKSQPRQRQLLHSGRAPAGRRRRSSALWVVLGILVLLFFFSVR